MSSHPSGSPARKVDWLEVASGRATSSHSRPAAVRQPARPFTPSSLPGAETHPGRAVARRVPRLP